MNSCLKGLLGFGKAHLGYLGLVWVALGHVLVVLLLESPHLVVFHGLGRHVLLLELLGQLVAALLLLVVQLVEFDLTRGKCTFFCTYRLFLSANTLI
jgi:hypothetical protein